MDFKVRAAYVRASDVKHKLVRNPNYSNKHVAFRGWCFTELRPTVDRKPLFFDALRESVRREGFRNPIVVYNFPEGLMLSFGGSRLKVAKELGLSIPAIVVDFTGQYDDCNEVTKDNYHWFFKDVPEYFVIDEDGVDTHYSLERNRRHSYDAAGLAWADNDAEFVKKEFGWINGN